MAITVYTGPPGSGKSYALVSQIIVPAVANGRRVVTNVDGVNPDLILAYCQERNPGKILGSVVRFTKADAELASFFPTESTGDADSFLKGGDILVFDEWRLSFPNRGKTPNENLEPFLRYHRHFVSPSGHACDVAIGTQLITDIHRDFRGVVERSYKFRNLKAVGAKKSYSYFVFDGPTQAKGDSYTKGSQRFKKEIFPLYSSYATDGEATELQTDKRASLFSKGFVVAGVLSLLFIVGGIYGAYSFFRGGADQLAIEGQTPAASSAPPVPVPYQGAVAPISPFRIVGFIQANGRPQVIISDDAGVTRLEAARDFQFENGRPVVGYVDGLKVIAKDRVVMPDRDMEL